MKSFEVVMGVNQTIARFFVDREPPPDNLFWKGKYIYISMGNGFVSIPVFYDLLYRIGVPMEKILEESHVQFMEQLMHFAMMQERNKISREEERAGVRSLLKGRVKNREWYEALTRYMDQPVLKPMGAFGLPHASLNRADMYLYILCDLPLTDEQWTLALKYWYALHPTYLIADDIGDYVKDKEDGEENVILDLGDGPEAFEKAFQMMQQYVETMREINPVLADYLTKYEETVRPLVPEN